MNNVAFEMDLWIDSDAISYGNELTDVVNIVFNQNCTINKVNDPGIYLAISSNFVESMKRLDMS